MGVINKAKNVLATAHLKILYLTLVEPYLNYCCIIWASPEKTIVLETLHKLQKRATRIIVYADYRAHSLPLFHRLNILNIYDLCRMQILTFVFKSTNNLLPSIYINYFTFAKELHEYSTRSSKSCNLYRITAHKSCRANVLVYRGPKYWNQLSLSVKSASSLRIFKRVLKQQLLLQYL